MDEGVRVEPARAFFSFLSSSYARCTAVTITSAREVGTKRGAGLSGNEPRL
jgi:hypothetical protein